MSAEAVAWSEESSDAELITAARGGDSAAFGALYERHAGAARTVARQYTRSTADADDVVSDAFARVYSIVRGGGGPDVAFRAYLFTVVRRLAHSRVEAGRRLQPTDDMAAFESAFAPVDGVDDPALAGFERGVVAKAYGSLPERWQAVLWYTEIERLQPAQVAPLLGLTANGVAALAYRAREGLREAYLQQHLVAAPSEGCRTVNGKLGAYVRGGLAKRESAQVRAHLETCETCRSLVLELGDVNHGLRGIIAPLVLGVAGLGALASPLPVGVLASVGVGSAGVSGAGAAGVSGAGAAAGTATGSGAAATGAGVAGTGAAGSGAAAGGGGVAVGAGTGMTVGGATGGAAAGGAAAAPAATTAVGAAAGSLSGGSAVATTTAAAGAGTHALTGGAIAASGAVTGTAGAVGAGSAAGATGAATGAGLATGTAVGGAAAAGSTALGAAGSTALGAAGSTALGAAGSTALGAAGSTALGAAGSTALGAAATGSTALAGAGASVAGAAGTATAATTSLGAAATGALAATGAASATGAAVVGGSTALVGAGTAAGVAAGGLGGLIAAIPGGVAGAVTAGVVGVSLAVGGALVDPTATRATSSSVQPDTGAAAPGVGDGDGSDGAVGASDASGTDGSGADLATLFGPPPLALPPSTAEPSTSASEATEATGEAPTPDARPASAPTTTGTSGAPAGDRAATPEPASTSSPALVVASSTGGPVVLVPGTTSTVSVTVTNTGDADATSLRAALLLPGGVELVDGGGPADAWQPCVDEAPGAPAEFCLAELPGGGSSVLVTEVRVDVGATVGETSIGVDVGAAGAAPRRLTVPADVVPAAVEVVLAGPDQATLTVGTPARVTFAVTDAGPGRARDLVATVALPAGVRWVGDPAEALPWDCAAAGDALTCALPQHAGSAELALTLAADPEVAGAAGLAVVLTVADAGGPGVARSRSVPLTVVAAPGPPLEPVPTDPIDPAPEGPPPEEPADPPAEEPGQQGATDLPPAGTPPEAPGPPGEGG